jgi:hypothetical protein
MCRETSLRLGIHLATVALIGALTASPGMAVEKAPSKAAAPAKEAAPPGKEAAPAKETAPVKETPAVKESGPNAPIDTRIGVLPSRAPKKPPVAGIKSPTGASVPSSVHPVRPPGPRDMSGVTRNAVGVSVNSHVGVTGPTPGPASHGPAALGLPKSPGSFATNPPAGASSVRPSVTPSGGPTSGAALQNRAGITGTGINRPGSGPATIGGAAKNAAAINGTHIRPKQQ